MTTLLSHLNHRGKDNEGGRIKMMTNLNTEDDRIPSKNFRVYTRIDKKLSQKNIE